MGAGAGGGVGPWDGRSGGAVCGVLWGVMGMRAGRGQPVSSQVKGAAGQAVSGARTADKTVRSTVRAAKKTKLFGGKKSGGAKKRTTTAKASKKPAKKAVKKKSAPAKKPARRKR